jgi:hypothetical protein
MINSQLLSIQNWEAWVPQLPSLKNSSTVATISANLKRRCSHLSKIALETANKAAINPQQIDYAVFCSRHGELACATDLLKDICNKAPLSPAKFSQSVHNTVAGLFCVMHHLQINTISIAARSNTFLMGMLEAFTWLKLNPNKTVLLVIYDEHTPEEFKTLNVGDDSEYAIALLLTDTSTKASSISFTLDNNTKQSSNKKMPLAIEFLQWYLEPTAKELIQKTNNYTAKWCKTDV